MAQEARLVAASPPTLLLDEGGRLGPRDWGREKGAAPLRMRPGREAPPLSRGKRAPVSHRKLINKLQS